MPIDTPLTLFIPDATPAKRKKLSVKTKTSKAIAEKIAEARKNLMAAYGPSCMPENYRVVEDLRGLGLLCRHLSEVRSFAWDTETSGLNPYRDILYCVSFFVGGVGYLVNFEHPLLPKIPISLFNSQVGSYFKDPDIKQYVYNGKFDRQVALQAGLDPGVPYMDGFEAIWLVNEAQKPKKLKNVAESYKLVEEGRSYTDQFGKTAWIVIDPKVSAYYAIKDADITHGLCDIFGSELKSEKKLWNLYFHLERPVSEVYFKTMVQGIDIDHEYLTKEITPLVDGEADRIRQEMESLIGVPDFSWGSNEDVGELLYNTLKLPRLHGFSVDKEALEDLSPSHPLPALILEWRTYTKLKSSFVTPILEMMVDGKVHPNLNSTGTETGRGSTTEPNMGQIPSRTELGRKIRKAFIAPPGFIWVSKDYDSQELRIQAALAKDDLLKQIIESGDKVYSWVAAIFWGGEAKDYSKHGATKEKYDKGKQGTLALSYGAQEFKMASIFGCGKGRAKQFIKDFFNKFPGLGKWQEKEKKKARSKGYVETVLGRRRRLDYSTATKWSEEQALDRLAVNTPNQGSAADQIKLAIVLLDRHFSKKGYKSRVAFSIYDEIIFLIKEEELYNTYIMQEIDYIMCNALPQLGIEFITTTEVYTNRWGELNPNFITDGE